MLSDDLPPRQASAEIAHAHAAEGSYVDWAAILAGGVFALALSFLLMSFGASLGLSLSSPYRGEGMSAAWLAIAAGIWFAWVMVTGFGAGGYLCGRMRRRAGDATAEEVEARDGVHGLMVWATGALVGLVLAASGLGGLVGAGSSVVGSAAGTVADVASEAASPEYFANLMLRGPGTPSRTGEDAPEAAQSPDAPATAPGAASQFERDGISSFDVGPQVRQEITGILARSAARGDMSERDRDYLAQLVAANSDLDATGARNRVDEVLAEIDEARAMALAAVEKARVAGVIFGFIAAATLLIGGVAAFFAAAAGGRHRDDGLGLVFTGARR